MPIYAQTPRDDAPAKQSPIDIVTGAATEGAKEITFVDYESITNPVLKHGGANFKVDTTGSEEGKNILKVGDKEYRLIQFHFHTPSEHTVDSTRYPLELHLVHQAEDGALAVVGIFFAKGEENAFLAQFFGKLPEAKVGEDLSLETISTSALELVDQPHWRYDGSLTTPPYSEGVSWVVIQKTTTCSKDQIGAFYTSVGGENARLVQPINGRMVTNSSQ